MYTYKLRPAYGGENLLLEFIKGPEEPSFLSKLLLVFADLEFKLEAAVDLWMNDEVLLSISSKAGAFTLTKDTWDLAFILADSNQEGIKVLDEYLVKSGLFKKLEADFNDYKK